MNWNFIFSSLYLYIISIFTAGINAAQILHRIFSSWQLKFLYDCSDLTAKAIWSGGEFIALFTWLKTHCIPEMSHSMFKGVTFSSPLSWKTVVVLWIENAHNGVYLKTTRWHQGFQGNEYPSPFNGGVLRKYSLNL